LDEKCLLVRFPIWPQTVEELQLNRFWLRAIYNTCFQRVTIHTLFNPEFLGLLFPSASASSPAVLFRSAELLTFRTAMPPLAYGPLVRARAVEFNRISAPFGAPLFPFSWKSFSDQLQLVCTFAVPPRQVEAYIEGFHPYSDREGLFKVGQLFTIVSFYSFFIIII
jgi:hypothetical protein